MYMHRMRCEVHAYHISMMAVRDFKRSQSSGWGMCARSTLCLIKQYQPFNTRHMCVPIYAPTDHALYQSTAVLRLRV